jgi:hypothetical protein
MIGISMSGPKQNFFGENYTPQPFGVFEWAVFAISLALGMWGFIFAQKNYRS